MTPRRAGYPRSRRRAVGVDGDVLEHVHQGHVIALARFYGFELIYHAPAGGKDGRVDYEQVGRGFPDLVLVKPPRLIFAELKTAKGKTTAAQDRWLEALRDVSRALDRQVTRPGDTEPTYAPARVEVYLWRPADLENAAVILAGQGTDPAAGVAYARNF